MPGVTITQADAERMARGYAQRGKALPDAMRGDPALVAAYHGAGGTDPAPAAPTSSPTPASSPAPSAPAPSRSASRAGRKLAKTRPAATAASSSSRPARRGYLDRAFSPSAAADSAGLGKVTRAGDAGGLLLALVLYPIGLAILQHGADGPRMWFEAKFLNQAYGQLSGLPDAASRKNVQRGDPEGLHFLDFGGFYGLRNAIYPHGVSGSKYRFLDGRQQSNPFYKGSGNGPGKVAI